MDSITLKSPAKINLRLDVLKKREDGYHEINTILQKISLYDEILIRLRTKEGIILKTDDASIPNDGRNLAYRAASIFLQENNLSTGVSIQIKKRIPHGAGLGGGSSNAALVLQGLNKLFNINLSNPRLRTFALRIGTDVPFFVFKSATAFAHGRGELLRSLRISTMLWLLIIIPAFKISTIWAYQNYKILTKKKKDIKLGNYLNFKKIISLLHNDLECVVVQRYPFIRKTKESLLKAGAKGALMSGSGSSVFGIFDNRQNAEKALAQLSFPDKHKVFIAHTL